ncbi:MAG: hypothetical protein EAZ84_00020 [Verrucomicrobia bacterium]|nr:MAG: hypothetical protein EAZ84_00020 [Verrucomicrobiota bacterium]
MSQIKGLLDEVENQSGALRSADEAEKALIGRLRKLGQTGLADWAEREASKLAVPPAGARRGSKKSVLVEQLWPGGGLGAEVA